MNRILPRPNALSQPYWDGCREGELRLQQCADCARFQFYPRIICSHCGGADLHWQAASGRGVLASFTVVERGISAAYPAPYVVALVDLDEGPRMMSQIVDPAPGRLRIGAAVEVAFENWSEDITLPVFRLPDHARGESP
jgi:uncharacterized OB-fold protein